jgi:hypothetical protein
VIVKEQWGSRKPSKRVGRFIPLKFSFLKKSTYVMQKAKLMLTAIVVFAAVGTGLAFKAQGFVDHHVYTESPIHPGICDQLVQFKTLGGSNPCFCTIIQGEPCTNTYSTIASN